METFTKQLRENKPDLGLITLTKITADKLQFQSHVHRPPHMNTTLGPRALPLLDVLRGSFPMGVSRSQKKVSRQSGQVDLLLDVNHLYKQAEWNFFLHVLQAFLGRE